MQVPGPQLAPVAAVGQLERAVGDVPDPAHAHRAVALAHHVVLAAEPVVAVQALRRTRAARWRSRACRARGRRPTGSARAGTSPARASSRRYRSQSIIRRIDASIGSSPERRRPHDARDGADEAAVGAQHERREAGAGAAAGSAARRRRRRGCRRRRRRRPCGRPRATRAAQAPGQVELVGVQPCDPAAAGPGDAAVERVGLALVRLRYPVHQVVVAPGAARRCRRSSRRPARCARR